MILEARDLCKVYRTEGVVSASVLRGASFTVEPHEFVAIVGPSGAGKSTLLHVLASIDTFDSGLVRVRVRDRIFDYTSMKEHEFARYRLEHVGFVYQFHHLLPEFTALENIMMPALIRGDARKDATIRAEMLLDRVGLGERSRHMPSELSGGEQQRVAMARAIMNKPALLFADEPTGNLDSANAQHVRALLRELQQEESLTCIVATHSIELAESATRIVHITDGVCV